MSRPIRAVPKPEGGKKSRTKTTTKTVDTAAVDEKRRAQNHINRNFGKSVERKVAELTGGNRVPMSGAVKNSVMALEGDVQVRSPDGKRVLALIECKGQSVKEGAKSFQIKVSVLEQAQREAAIQRAFAAVWYHLKGENYDSDWVMVPANDFLRMLEGLKEVYTIETMGKDTEE